MLAYKVTSNFWHMPANCDRQLCVGSLHPSICADIINSFFSSLVSAIWRIFWYFHIYDFKFSVEWNVNTNVTAFCVRRLSWYVIR